MPRASKPRTEEAKPSRPKGGNAQVAAPSGKKKTATPPCASVAPAPKGTATRTVHHETVGTKEPSGARASQPRGGHGSLPAPDPPPRPKKECQTPAPPPPPLGQLLLPRSPSVAVGHLVAIVAGVTAIGDPKLFTKMPVVGLVTSVGVTTALVTYMGVVDVRPWHLSPLLPGRRYFVGVDGLITVLVPTARPLFVQIVGVALDESHLLLTLDGSFVKLN